MDDDVDLLGADRHAGDAADEPEDEQREHQRAEPGVAHGARRSQSNIPFVNPRRRMPSSIPAGTVKPWIIDASTAMHMK